MAGSVPSSIEASLQNQSRKLLIEGTSLGTFDRVRSRHFYSSYLFPVGLGNVIPSGRYEVFQSIAGDSGQGYQTVTSRETNWLQRGRLPDQQNILTRSFHVGIRRPTSDRTAYPMNAVFGVAAGNIDLNPPVHPIDVQRIAYGATISYKYLTNTIPIGLLADYPEPGGLYGSNTASRQNPSTDAESNVSGTPVASINNRGNLPIMKNSTTTCFERRQKVPSLLQHGENFSMVISVPTAIPLLGPHPQAGDFPQLNDSTGVIEIVVGFYGVESFVEKS